MCSSKDILKVGHSIEQDLQKIFNYFSKKYKINRKVLMWTCSIDVELFTIKPPQTLGLSDISYRYLGKYMRKKESSVRTGSKEQLTNDV